MAVIINRAVIAFPPTDLGTDVTVSVSKLARAL
jgi:hypothetical protein